MMACPGDCGFASSFRSRLIEVEQHALLEFQRLGDALAALHAENRELRRQLAAGTLDSCSAGSLYSAQAPDACSPPCSPPCSPCGPCGSLEEGEWPSAASPSPQLQRSNSGAAYRENSERPVSEGSHLMVPGNSAANRQSEVRTRFSRQRQETRSVRLYKRIGLAQRVARSSAFEYGTLALVVLNAAWMAIDLDLNSSRELLQSPLHFQLIEHLFVALFSLEIAVRFLAFESKRSALSDRWFLFDAVLVILMVVDSWLLTLVVLLTDGSGVAGLGSVSVLRALRILRLGRIARLCAVVPELETMVSSMVAGVRSVLTAAVFLLATTYGFAIALRQMGESTAWGAEHFASVPGAIWTLLVESMLPDNGELLGQMGQERWYCSLVYFAFLLFSAVLLMNMLVGLLCDVVFQVSHTEKTQRGIDSMSAKLQAILGSIDRNYDGLVSKTEFESMIENKDAIGMLRDVGVDVVALVGESDLIFSQHGRSQLPFEEFRDEVLAFRCSSSPTMGTITAFRRFLHMGLEHIAGRLATVEMLLDHSLARGLLPTDAPEAPAAAPTDAPEVTVTPPGKLQLKRSL